MRITDDVDLKLLSQTPLFSYLSRDEISDITDALQCSIRNYKRGEVLMQSGGHTDYSGLVLKGRVIIKTAPNLDGRGMRTISWTAYTAYPSFLRYSSGLSHPSDSLILSLR